MKKYLFFAVAALGLAACAEKGLEESKSPVENGEFEQSYVAVTLAADDMSSKAADGVYDEGTAAERAVKSAYVFFFKDGAAFHVAFDGTTSTNSAPCNYLEVNLNANGNDMDNVSDIHDAVLILQNYKGEYPNQIVAVLNWDPTAKVSYTLSELQTKIADLGSDAEGYVMSNAVYADNEKQTIDAVALTIDNIGKTEKEALDNPVTIHVERIAAKVVFTAENGGRFPIEKEIDGTDLYAQIMNFELYNDYEQSWLIKRIDPEWNGIGFAWNDADWFRSYWSRSLGTSFPENTFMWSSDNTALDGYVYCGENTRAWTEDADVRTKVIVKAQLQDASGNPVEVVNWYGKDYIGEDKLKTVVANTLKNTYFSGDGVTFTGITPADIRCVARDPQDENAYEVYFQLSGTGAAKNWYKYADGNYNAINANADLDAVLAAVQPALVYKNGMTYYWTEIKHLGAPGSLAEYGVVRNHVYKVNIKDITGYGTPFYTPTIDFIVPDKPEDIITYVAAQINILSWRVVRHDYTLE